MRVLARVVRVGRAGAIALAVGCGAARAQWTQVAEIPATPLFSFFVNSDTLAAGADTTVHLSTDGGATWRHSAKPVSGVRAITAVRVRNGRVFAGTFGQGVFTSDDLGLGWQGFNQGLTGGAGNSQLDIDDLVPRGDTLYAATAGAGVYLRRLTSGTWQPTGTVFDPQQALVVNSIALGGTRLLALAGGNGMVFRNDPGEPDWTESDLNNAGIAAGVQATTAIWTGTGWVVGTNIGVFRSVAGQEPWTPVGLGLGPLRWTSFASQGGQIFAAFVTSAFTVVAQSGDGGASWTDPEVFPGVFVQALGISHGQLYAARADGLWLRAQPPLAVPPPVAATRVGLACAGPQPCAERATFRIELPSAGSATLELFDIAGRRAGVRVEGTWPAGSSTVSLDARGLAPGVYAARLVAGAAHAELRVVHVR